MTATTVDPRKVQLAEKDIEDWLWENPEAIRIDGTPLSCWLARQLTVPSGIIDLLGIIEYSDNTEGIIRQAVVVEVKNTEITAEALTQVSRYAADINQVLDDASLITYFDAEKVVVGRGSLTKEIAFESKAIGIRLMTFDVKLDLKLLGPWDWENTYTERLRQSYKDLAESPTFSIFRRETIVQKDDTDDIIEEARNILKGSGEQDKESDEQ